MLRVLLLLGVHHDVLLHRLRQRSVHRAQDRPGALGAPVHGVEPVHVDLRHCQHRARARRGLRQGAAPVRPRAHHLRARLALLHAFRGGHLRALRAHQGVRRPDARARRAARRRLRGQDQARQEGQEGARQVGFQEEALSDHCETTAR